jgi:hypothetical protein
LEVGGGRRSGGVARRTGLTVRLQFFPSFFFVDYLLFSAIERLAVLCGDPRRNRGVQATFGHMVLLFARAMIFHFAARALRSLVCDIFPT